MYGTRLGVSLLLCLYAALLAYFIPDGAFSEAMLASACPTSFRRLKTLLLLVPLSFAYTFLLSPTLDSHHLAGPRSLCLSLHRVDIPLVFISFLSTLLSPLVISPATVLQSPGTFPSGGPSS